MALSLNMSDPPAYNFAQALADALQTHRCSTIEAGRFVGVSPSMVSHWSTGRNVPGPTQVFALEAGLGLRPGELSRHLGYQPNAAFDAPPLTASVPEAIRTDELLGRNPALREMVLRIYQSAIDLIISETE